MTVYSPAINTYVPLESIVLTNAASSVTFFNISQSYRDLVLVVEGAVTSNSDVGVQFNGDTASNYSYVLMRGYPTTTTESSANTYDRIYLTHSSVVSTSRFMSRIEIMDFSDTSKHKTAISRSDYDGATGKFVEAKAHRWANTAAITTMRILTGTTFATGTTFTLFAIAS